MKNLIIKILTYFKTMMSNSDEASSKRFAAIFTLFNLLILTYIATFNSKGVTPQFMFEALCWIVCGGLGLSVAEKFFNKKSNTPSDTDDSQKTPENK